MSGDSFYELRIQRDQDKAFIMATFLKGVYYGTSFYRDNVEKRIFMDNYKQVAEVLLATCAVVVACLKEDNDVILGYSIVSPDGSTVHWCFVKRGWRGRGLGKALVPRDAKVITHYTQIDAGKDTEENPKAAINRLLRQFNNCIFNPFAL